MSEDTRSAIYEAFMSAAGAKDASGQDVEAALITLVAVHVGHNCPTVARQDAWLNWFVAGVENLLKVSGARTTARPNPLASSRSAERSPN